MAVAVAALVPLAAACGGERSDGGGAAGGGASARPVTGVHWSVDSVTADGEEHPVPEGAHLTVTADGTAEGSYGCNDFHAKASVDGDRLRLSDARSTEIGCVDRPMDVEQLLVRALTAGPLTTEVDGDRLTLTTTDGDTVRLSDREGATG